MASEVGKIGARGSRGVGEGLNEVVRLDAASLLSKQERLMFIRLSSHKYSDTT